MRASSVHFVPSIGGDSPSSPKSTVRPSTCSRSGLLATTAAMQEAKRPTIITKLPNQSPPLSASAPTALPLPYQHHYGTFSPPPPPSQLLPVVGAAYYASPTGFSGQGAAAFPCTVQQQVFVDGVPVRESPLPFCGVGIGWVLKKIKNRGELVEGEQGESHDYTKPARRVLGCLGLVLRRGPEAVVGAWASSSLVASGAELEAGHCAVAVTGVVTFRFLLGFFLAAIPWYTGAFLLFFIALDHREKAGLIACTIAGIFALVPFILNGIRMQPFW